MNLSALNTFDIIILSIVFLSTLFAFFRGFFQTLFSFLAWVGSIFFAVYLLPMAKPIASNWVESDVLASSVAFIGVYLLLLIVISLVGFKVVSVVHHLRLGPIDRSLGLVFGVLRGVFLVTIAFILINLFFSLFGMKEPTKTDIADEEEQLKKVETSTTKPSWLTDAVTYPMLKTSQEYVIGLLPQTFWDEIISFTSNAAYQDPLKEEDTVKTVNAMVEHMPGFARRKIEDKHWEDRDQEARLAYVKKVFKMYNKYKKTGELKGETLPKEDISLVEDAITMTEEKTNSKE